MNLLVPSDQVPTIVDVRCGRTDVLLPRMRAGHCHPQAHRIGRTRIRAPQEPQAQAIAVGRGPAIRAAWLAVILNVDTEHDAPCRAVAVGHGIVTHAGEADRIVRCPARLRATDPVTRIAQPVGDRARARLGGGAARQTWASVAVTVRPVAPTTSHVTDTSSHALPVRPLTLPVADAIAPGSSDAMVAGVVGTGVPAPVGGQVGSFVKMLSAIAQFASATPPVFVTLN